MQVKEERRDLLKSLGLKDDDFEKFDGKHVRYEYDEKKKGEIYRDRRLVRLEQEKGYLYDRYS